MRTATRTVASWFGVAAGIAGIEHGYYEILQGNTQPTDHPGHHNDLICEIKNFLSSSFLVREWLAVVS